MLGSAKRELQKLKAEHAKLEARTKALLVERDFWVEQGRSLQNQLQTWQRMYSSLFDQLGRGVVTDQTIADNLALAAEEMRQPIAVVEAARAAFALAKEDTQGTYTAVGRGADGGLLLKGDRNG